MTYNEIIDKILCEYEKTYPIENDIERRTLYRIERLLFFNKELRSAVGRLLKLLDWSDEE